jgi:hypothetical protein
MSVMAEPKYMIRLDVATAGTTSKGTECVRRSYTADIGLPIELIANVI